MQTYYFNKYWFLHINFEFYNRIALWSKQVTRYFDRYHGIISHSATRKSRYRWTRYHSDCQSEVHGLFLVCYGWGRKNQFWQLRILFICVWLVEINVLRRHSHNERRKHWKLIFYVSMHQQRCCWKLGH